MYVYRLLWPWGRIVVHVCICVEGSICHALQYRCLPLLIYFVSPSMEQPFTLYWVCKISVERWSSEIYIKSLLLIQLCIQTGSLNCRAIPFTHNRRLQWVELWAEAQWLHTLTIVCVYSTVWSSLICSQGTTVGQTCAWVELLGQCAYTSREHNVYMYVCLDVVSNALATDTVLEEIHTQPHGVPHTSPKWWVIQLVAVLSKCLSHTLISFGMS